MHTAMFLAAFTEVGLGDSPAAQMWRALMTTMAYPYQSRLRHQWREEGREEGRSEGRAEEAAAAVLRVLDARALPVPAATAERIRTETNLAVLETMLTRAVTVERAEDLFDD